MALTKMARTNRATRAIAVSQPVPTVLTTALSTTEAATAVKQSRAEQNSDRMKALRALMSSSDEDGQVKD
jgi:hypothetical protein